MGRTPIPLLTGLAVAACFAAAACTGATPTSTPTPTTLVRSHVRGATELVANAGDTGIPAHAADPVAGAEQSFALDLLRQVARDTSTVSSSPASLALALAMLENGATGTTRSEIAHVLHTGSLTPTAQNQGWADLTNRWNNDRATTIDTANALWVQRGLVVRPQFLDALGRWYDAGTWQVDFGTPDAVTALNAWTKQRTHGKITKLFDHLPAGTEAVLANAVYFSASWQVRFERAMTAAHPFTRADGSTVSVPFVSSDGLTVPAAVTRGYQAVELPYRGGRFAALAIMPTRQSLRSYLAALTTDRLDAVVSSLRRQLTSVTMPRFTTRSTLQLNDTLSRLGMPRAFDDAQFGALSPRPLAVTQVQQRVYLSVGENGTEAAAASGIGVASSARVADTTVTLNRPFLFLVRDTKTGAILFATALYDPSAS